ncbi:fimbrial protein [Xenorhabdus littoralis]|uniref:fimbrial protein n=1 Tax=Xenorhabdus littoralis TaxID=2582835 RepID=UPI0029E7F36D|nr:fimbrial protein [Xenorhabdus sp. psl]MDX7990965.1 adhesin [Xenorhabdus sp. psl]
MASRLKLLLAGLFIVGMISSFASQADNRCDYYPGVTAKTTVVSFGNIVIPRDHPIGTHIKEIRLDQVDTQGNLAYCNYQPQATWDKPDFERAHYNYDSIYESGIPGVGIRINTWTQGSNFGIDWFPRTVNPAFNCHLSQEPPGKLQYCGKTWGYLTVQLIKIAPITDSGKIQRKLLTRARLGSDIAIHTFYLADTNIVTQGCSLKQTTTFVDMGNIKTSEFSGINSTAGTTGFDLTLDCDANLSVAVSLDGRPAKSNSNNIWALDYSSDNVTAKGIGVQILWLNRPLSMREPFIVRSGQKTIRHFSLPMQARYIQTEAKVIPGKADATAAITLTYQ